MSTFFGASEFRKLVFQSGRPGVYVKTKTYGNPDARPEARILRPSSVAELGRFKEKLREALGGRSVRGFASACGLSQASLLSYLSGDTYPTLDRLAAIAEAAERPIAWFFDAPEASQSLSGESLTMAIQLAAEALDGRSLPPPDYAELVGLIYEGLVEGLPEAKILRFARIGARGGQGRSDASREGDEDAPAAE